MMRIAFLIKCSIAAFVLGWPGLLAQVETPTKNTTPAQKPNIVLILADDLGWKDLGYMGSSFYETPHIDRLASEGMWFSNCYAAAANCAPSRACLMTGQFTPRHGIYTVDDPARGDSSSRKLVPAPNNRILADHFYTLAEAMKTSGYHTSIVGKWHIGSDATTQGFDVKIGGNHKGHNNYFSPYHNPGIPDGPAGEYLTDRLTTEAIKLMEQQSRQQPFFLYMPYFAVHTPLEAPADLFNKFKSKKGGAGQQNAAYAAMIASLDTNVGRLLKRLEELKLSDNTIVILTSDNGGIRAISNQAPLRAGKGSYYEGGIRVPMVIKWPGKTVPGSKTDIPVTHLDLYPTFMEIVSGKPTSGTLDGVSICSVLSGENLPERPLYWHFPIYLQAYNEKLDEGRDPKFRTRPGSVIRQGDWKLHEYFEDGALELYNLKNDIGERKNVAHDFPDIREKLHSMLQSWRKETHAPVPDKPNPAYKNP